MNKVFLYKNGELVLEKTGTKENNNLLFENIVFDLNLMVLTREDDNFKYVLDFKNESALVLIKENNYSLNIKINVLSLIEGVGYIEIKYNIESEVLIENKIIINYV